MRASRRPPLTISNPSAGGHTIREEGVDLPIRTGLNLREAAVATLTRVFDVVDDPAGDETEVIFAQTITRSDNPEVITASWRIDSTTSLRFGGASGPTLAAAATGNDLLLVGDFDVSGHSAFGAAGTILAQSVVNVNEGFSNVSGGAAMNLQATFTQTVLGLVAFGVDLFCQIQPGTNADGQTVTGMRMRASNAAGAGTGHILLGIDLLAQHVAAGSSSASITGGRWRTLINAGSVGEIIGGSILMQFQGGACTVGATGLHIRAEFNVAVPPVTRGLRISDLVSGTTKNPIAVEAQTLATATYSFHVPSFTIGAEAAPDGTLDVRGEITIIGASAALARLRLRGFYTASPANPPVDQADIMIIDDGVSRVLRVRYNDAGVMRVGDLALV